MAVVANAGGMPPAARGMSGVRTTLEAALDDFARLGLLERGPIVEYTLGIPNGVFVIFRSDDPLTQRDLRYLKLGDGPYYLLHRPFVLIHYEAPLSAAEAVLYRHATGAPRPADRRGRHLRQAGRRGRSTPRRHRRPPRLRPDRPRRRGGRRAPAAGLPVRRLPPHSPHPEGRPDHLG
jgi:hypothetical protein